MRLWNYLLELLLARRVRLELSMAIQKILHKMLYVLDWMDELKVGITCCICGTACWSCCWHVACDSS